MMNFLNARALLENLVCRFCRSARRHDDEDHARLQELNRSLKAHWESHSFYVRELISECFEPNRPAEQKSNYIVFLDEDLDIDWITDFDIEGEMQRYVSMAASVDACRCKHLPPEQIVEFKRILGQAIVCALNENYSQCRSLCIEAKQYLESRTTERSREWILKYAHLFLFVFAAALQGLFFVWPRLSDKFAPSGELVFYALLGGLLGAYVSITTRTTRGRWDAAAGKHLHILEVGSKLFAGIVLGGLAYAITNSMHAPKAFIGLAPDNCSSLIFGAVAGLCEGFVPKIISAYADNKQLT